MFDDIILYGDLSKKKPNLTFQIKIIVTLYVIFTNEMESKLYLTPQVFTFPEKVLCILI